MQKYIEGKCVNKVLVHWQAYSHVYYTILYKLNKKYFKPLNLFSLSKIFIN